MFRIADPRCELAVNPLGIDARLPRFSWALSHSERGQAQTAHQVLVASTLDRLESGSADLWDSGKVPASTEPLVAYAGRPLGSRQRGYWKARSWDAQDRPSAYGDPAWFELGLLEPEDWTAEWIGFPAGKSGKALYFRRPFRIEKPLARARAYVCGLGWHELRLNGQKVKVGGRVLDPAQTAYSSRVLYTTYDVGPLLRPDVNVVGAIVGSGWYGVPKLLLQLELEFADGTSARVVTGRGAVGGGPWGVRDGAITSNSVFDGEVYDARLEEPGWDAPEGVDPSAMNTGAWRNAMAIEPPGGRLVAQAQEPIEVVETIRPRALSRPKPGIYVFDVGQNVAGWAALTARGPSGTAVTLRFAESLYEDGTVNQENLRAALARDVYVLKGDGVEVWEPRFTYHGFRYVQIEGFPGEPDLDSIRARIVRTAAEPVGRFECDHPLVNQLHRAVWWTEASNLHGIPTDCPQRDERMGWLNDMAARSEEALHNFDLARLLPKWLSDVGDTQDPATGAISDTAPYRWGTRPADPVSVCYLLIPWLLRRFYGDLRVLAEHYDGMKRWVDYLTTRSDGHVVEYSYYGDWAPPLAEGVEGSIGSSAVARNTPGSLVSTAHYYYGATLLSRIASAVGRETDAVAYRQLADRIASAFDARFWDEAQGGYGTNNQACNAIALYMGLVPEERRARVVANLVADVERHDHHLTTGNLASKYILEVLAEAGRADVAFGLVTQTSYPSWGYMLENGATTIWERWERMTGGGMNSHNHPMFGSVGAWLYRWLAGLRIDPSASGFSRLLISPFMPEGMRFARASLRTVRGPLEAGWERQSGGERGERGYSLRARIPVGCEAEVGLPKAGPAAALRVTEGGTEVWRAGRQTAAVPGLSGIREEERAIVCAVGSGDYQFTVETL